jgi:hypothetical protein
VEAEAISGQGAASGPPAISFSSPEAEAISTPSSQVAASGPPAISFFSIPTPDPIEAEAEDISTPSSQVAASGPLASNPMAAFAAGPPVPDQLGNEVESIINYADLGLIPHVTVNA